MFIEERAWVVVLASAFLRLSALQISYYHRLEIGLIKGGEGMPIPRSPNVSRNVLGEIYCIEQ